jgi:hypothetical protein
MTIEKEIGIIRLRVKKIDENAQFLDEYIRYIMSSVFNQMIGELFEAKDRRQLNYYCKEYTEVLATYNATTDEYSIALPAAIIATPFDKSGIKEGVRDINYLKSRDLNFIPVTTEHYSLYSGQDVYLIDSKIRYMTFNDRIVFVSGITNTNKSTFTATGLKLLLLVSLEEYDYTDELPIPAGKDEEFLLRTVNILLGTPPPDQTINNA